MDVSPIISTQALAEGMQSKHLRIVDCRFNLADPNWGYQDYLSSHIPGALYAHLNRDLSGPVSAHTGRHPLPEAASFLDKLASWGITPETHVVVYDTVGGAFASRLWLMLKAVGHRHVQVLDGGFQKWQAESRPVSAGPESCTPVDGTSGFYTNFDPQLFVSTQEIEAALTDPSVILIDARAPERFQGAQEPIDPVAGHIPGAVNRFHGANLTAEEVFKSNEALRAEISVLLKNHPAAKAIVYCGSGVTSCHHLVALKLAGLTGARLYAGSWSEWIRDPARPIAKGPK